MAYTDAELLELLRQLAGELGETPTQKQCTDAETTPTARTYQRRFGSWNDAVKAAHLSINETSYTDDELIACLQEFADTHGETPTKRQLNNNPELPSTDGTGRVPRGLTLRVKPVELFHKI